MSEAERIAVALETIAASLHPTGETVEADALRLMREWLGQLDIEELEQRAFYGKGLSVNPTVAVVAELCVMLDEMIV